MAYPPDKKSSCYLTIVVPFFNENRNVVGVYNKIKSACEKIDGETEIVFIDDGSVDGTREALKNISDHDGSVTVISFRRNFGQTAALAAGFDHARGEMIISMDGDGQNDPSDIPMMLAKLEEGYDVVNGWRRDRKDSFIMRRLPSILGNFLIRILTGVKIKDFGCTLKAYRKEIIREISLYGEMHRMIPVLAHLMGASIVEVEVKHHARVSGKSKYTNWRALSVILDLVTLKFFSGYFTRPSHFFGLVGLTSIFLGIISFALLLIMKFASGTDMTGNPFLIIGVLFSIVGTQLLMLGLIGEVMVRTYYESQKKPTYIVKEIWKKADV